MAVFPPNFARDDGRKSIPTLPKRIAGMGMAKHEHIAAIARPQRKIEFSL
jgi:hypothetical protein